MGPREPFSAGSKGSSAKGLTFKDRKEPTRIEQWPSPDSDLEMVTDIFSFQLFIHPFYGKGP